MQQRLPGQCVEPCRVREHGWRTADGHRLTDIGLLRLLLVGGRTVAAVDVTEDAGTAELGSQHA